MKKIIVTLAVLLLLVASLAVMSSCGGTTEPTEATTTAEAVVTTQPVVTTTPETTPAALPEGYTLYENGSISFAYPETFIKTTSDGIDMVSDATNGNNVNVVTEAKNTYYATMDINDFNTDVLPLLEQSGLTVTGASVAQVKNAAGTSITKIAYTASIMGITMKQTQFITTVGNKTYTVTVTEMVNNQELVDTVFDSLKPLK